MKKTLLIMLTAIGLFAGDTFTKGELVSEYLAKAKKEVPQNRYQNELKLLTNDRNYKLAKEIETNKEQLSKDGKNLHLARYDKVIEKLYEARQSSGSVLASYVAVEIGWHIWLMRNQELNKKYLKELTEDLYAHKYCRGYYQQGRFLWAEGSREKAIDVLKEGAENCKEAYLLREIKLQSAKYQYLLKRHQEKNKK